MKNSITQEKLIKLGFSHTEKEETNKLPFTDKYTRGNIILLKNRSLSNLSHAIGYEQNDYETGESTIIIFKWITSMNEVKKLMKVLK